MAGPGQGTPAAEYQVQFTAQGFGAIREALTSMGGNMTALAGQFGAFGNQFERTAQLVGASLASAMNTVAIRKSAEGLGVLQSSLGSLGVSMSALDERAKAMGSAFSFADLASKGLAQLDGDVGTVKDDLYTLRRVLESLGPAGLAVSKTLGNLNQGIGAAPSMGAQAGGAAAPAAAAAQQAKAVVSPVQTLAAALAKTFAGVGAALAGTGAVISGTTARVLGLTSAAAAAQKTAAGMTQTMTGLGQTLQGSVATVSALAAGVVGLGASFGRIDWQKTGQGFAGLSSALSGVVGLISPVTSRLEGMVLGAINASAMGQVMSYQWAELGRQMGSIFVPTVRLVIGKLYDLIAWFRNLSGEQQASLRHWGLLVAGFTTLAPRVISAVGSIVQIVGGLRLAITMLTAHPLVLVATALAAIGVAALSTMDAGEGMKLLGDIGATVAKSLQASFKDLVSVIQGVGEAAKAVAESLSGMKAPDFLQWLGHISNTPEAARRLMGAGTNEMRKKGLHKKADFWEGAAGIGLGMNPVAMPFLMLSRMLGIPEYQRVRPGSGSKDRQPREELPEKLGGFESIEQTYRRIAEASVRATSGVKSPMEESRDLLQQIYNTIAPLAAAGPPRPPIR